MLLILHEYQIKCRLLMNSYSFVKAENMRILFIIHDAIDNFTKSTSL